MNAGIESGGSALLARAKAIILTPREEWPKIAAESSEPRDVFTRHVIPLAAIGPVAGLIGGQVFGYGAFGFNYRPGLVGSIGTAVVSYALTLAGLAVLALIAEFLAPKFGGEANRAQAFKLVGYGSTASFLAGIFGLIPSLGFFGLLGLYSIYLYYTGAAPLMKVPEDKSMAYTAVTILAAFLLSLIVMPITLAVTGAIGLGAMSASSDQGEITLPGGGTIDSGKVEDLSKRVEDAASGKVKPVETAKLQALIPASISGYNRVSTESAAVGNIGSTAEGRFEDGSGHYINLKLVDMSAMGAIAGLGAAFGVEQNREDAKGYERTGTVDGRMQMESWDRANSSGRFAIIHANRFMVEALGNTASIDDLKAAVSAIDPDDLEDLAE